MWQKEHSGLLGRGGVPDENAVLESNGGEEAGFWDELKGIFDSHYDLERKLECLSVK